MVHEVCGLLKDKTSESHEEKGSSLGLVRDATKVNQQLDFDYVPSKAKSVRATSEPITRNPSKLTNPEP